MQQRQLWLLIYFLVSRKLTMTSSSMVYYLCKEKVQKSSDGSAKNTEARFTGGVVQPRQSISRLFQYLRPFIFVLMQYYTQVISEHSLIYQTKLRMQRLGYICPEMPTSTFYGSWHCYSYIFLHLYFKISKILMSIKLRHFHSTSKTIDF